MKEKDKMKRKYIKTKKWKKDLKTNQRCIAFRRKGSDTTEVVEMKKSDDKEVGNTEYTLKFTYVEDESLSPTNVKSPQSNDDCNSSYHG